MLPLKLPRAAFSSWGAPCASSPGTHFFNKTKVLYIVALLTHSLERVIASALRYVGADLSPRESADDESSGMGGREGEAREKLSI